MKAASLLKKFEDEAYCVQYFRKQKESQGITCKKCGSTRHYWNKTHKAHDCCNCRYRTTLRSGTVMEASKLPFGLWLQAMVLMTMTKKGISALEMQRQLGHKFYEPIWYMMHKLRSVMGIRDSLYEFDGMVEVDDAFFKIHEDEEDDNRSQSKRGRGTEEKSKVLVMAKVEPKVGRPRKHHKPSAFRYVKMVVIPDSSSQTMNSVVFDHISPEARVKSDGWSGFNRLHELVSKHYQNVVRPKDAAKALPWVHTMISNAKRTFLGRNHNIKNDYLQNYLDEFCYKTNRRYFKDNLFERLVIASIHDTWYGNFRYAS